MKLFRKSPLRVVLAIYKATLSPVLACLGGGGCRFTPTCSEYFVEAVERHGAWKGFILGVGRLARCHPWGGCGADPVPPSSSGSGRPGAVSHCSHCK